MKEFLPSQAIVFNKITERFKELRNGHRILDLCHRYIDKIYNEKNLSTVENLLPIECNIKEYFSKLWSHF